MAEEITTSIKDMDTKVSALARVIALNMSNLRDLIKSSTPEGFDEVKENLDTLYSALVDSDGKVKKVIDTSNLIDYNAETGVYTNANNEPVENPFAEGTVLTSNGVYSLINGLGEKIDLLETLLGDEDKEGGVSLDELKKVINSLVEATNQEVTFTQPNYVTENADGNQVVIIDGEEYPVDDEGKVTVGEGESAVVYEVKTDEEGKQYIDEVVSEPIGSILSRSIENEKAIAEVKDEIGSRSSGTEGEDDYVPASGIYADIEANAKANEELAELVGTASTDEAPATGLTAQVEAIESVLANASDYSAIFTNAYGAMSIMSQAEKEAVDEAVTSGSLADKFVESPEEVKDVIYSLVSDYSESENITATEVIEALEKVADGTEGIDVVVECIEDVKAELNSLLA